jgi:2-polyprenyl-3-methyl-5-hydroxy-6-metoxy-1,4-benzoquinol methylase
MLYGSFTRPGAFSSPGLAQSRFGGSIGVDRETLKAYESDTGLFERLDSFNIDQNGDQSLLPKAFPVVMNFGTRPKPAILDVGCGTSTFMRWLGQRGYEAYGMDPWRSGIAQAKRKYPALANRLKEGALPELGNPFNRKFDGILCSATLMHLPDKSLLSPSVTAMKRLLKPNGAVYISISQEGRELNAQGRDEKNRLFTHFSSDELIKAFTSQGFELVEQAQDIDDRRIGWGNFLFKLKA